MVSGELCNNKLCPVLTWARFDLAGIGLCGLSPAGSVGVGVGALALPLREAPPAGGGAGAPVRPLRPGGRLRWRLRGRLGGRLRGRLGGRLRGRLGGRWVCGRWKLAAFSRQFTITEAEGVVGDGGCGIGAAAAAAHGRSQLLVEPNEGVVYIANGLILAAVGRAWE